MKKRIIVGILSLIMNAAFAAPGPHDGDKDYRKHERDDHKKHGWDRHYVYVPVQHVTTVRYVVAAPACQPPVQCGPVPIDPSSFCQLEQTISNAAFESSKLDIFRQALTYNFFTSQQVRDLMDLFSFESTKLTVTELAFSKTVDPNNYYIVNNGFAFNSSIYQLGQYQAMR